MNPDPTARLHTRIIEHRFDGTAPVDFDDEIDLITDGALCSLAIMRTIDHLESGHGISVADGDIVPDHFARGGTLSAFIRAKAGRHAE